MTTFPLPDPNIGGLPTNIKPSDVEDPKKLARLLQLMNERFSGAQLNFEALAAAPSLTQGFRRTYISTEESRTNTAFGTLTTPDQVTNVGVPESGLLCVLYHAQWKASVASAAQAAIFLNENQVKGVFKTSASPVVQAANHVHTTPTTYQVLGTIPGGLYSFDRAHTDETEPVAYTGDVTTGQIMGPPEYTWAYRDTDAPSAPLDTLYQARVNSKGSPLWIFANPGSYTVSVRFKSTSGSVTAKERRLWVWTVGF